MTVLSWIVLGIVGFFWFMIWGTRDSERRMQERADYEWGVQYDRKQRERGIGKLR